MFCNKCGEELSDDAKFCRKCGNAISVKRIEKKPVESVNDIPNHEFEELKRKSYQVSKVELVKIVREQYNVSLTIGKEIVDAIYEMRNSLTQSIQKNNTDQLDSSKTNERKKNNSYLINKNREELLEEYKKIRCVVNDLLEKQSKLDNAVITLKEYEKKEKDLREKNGILANICYFVSLFIIVIGLGGGFSGFIGGLAIGFVISLIATLIDQKFITKDKYILQANEFHEKEVKPIYSLIEECKREIELVWETDEMLVYEANIPDQYSNLETIDFFIHALEIGRASNQKELINIYEEELHRRRLEQTQSQILNMQKEQLETSKKQASKLNDIAKNQKKISRQVKYGNTVSTLDYLFKK